MRRVIQKAVENTVAKQMLSGEVGAGSTVKITLSQVEAVFASADEARLLTDDSSAD